MRVAEKYRVWHDVCHMDDAKMAAVGNYIDGYVQLEGDDTALPVGKNSHLLSNGGWHDAGDFDLRIESQLGESYILTRAWEAFRPDIDVTSIDFDKHVTEIHQPDGKMPLPRSTVTWPLAGSTAGSYAGTSGST